MPYFHSSSVHRGKLHCGYITFCAATETKDVS